jgi:hypothetical protein
VTPYGCRRARKDEQATDRPNGDRLEIINNLLATSETLGHCLISRDCFGSP